jgi:hypothetical protein
MRTFEFVDISMYKCVLARLYRDVSSRVYIDMRPLSAPTSLAHSKVILRARCNTYRSSKRTLASNGRCGGKGEEGKGGAWLKKLVDRGITGRPAIVRVATRLVPVCVPVCKCRVCVCACGCVWCVCE